MPIVGVPPVVAAIYNTAIQQVFTSGGVHIINYDTKEKDTHNAVTIGATWKFTAPVAGFYVVRASVLLQLSAAWDDTDYAYIAAHVNGSSYAALVYVFNPGTAESVYMFVAGNTMVYLAKDDYIDFRLVQASGEAIPMYWGRTTNRVSIIKYAGG